MSSPIALGLGCDRGTPATTLVWAVVDALARCGASLADVAAVASIDLKADEPGLHALADWQGWTIRFYPAAALAADPDAPDYDERIAALAAIPEWTANVLADRLADVLADPALGAPAIARRFGVSRATLYRLFSRYGSIADYILRDHPRCVNVFVSASKEARIERLMRIHNIPSEAAEELMEKADKKRSSYYNYYSYKTWGAAETYHLCIDSSVLGIDGTVQFIKEFVKLKLGIQK